MSMIEDVYRAHYSAVRQRLLGKISKSVVTDKPKDGVMKIGSHEWWKMEYARREKKRQELSDRLIARAEEKYGKTPRSSAIQIMHDVAAAHGFTYADIIGKSRKVKLVAARVDAIKRVKASDPKKSLPELGRLFGGRDHTTILHALRKPYNFQPGKRGFKPTSKQARMDQQVGSAHE